MQKRWVLSIAIVTTLSGLYVAGGSAAPRLRPVQDVDQQLDQVVERAKAVGVRSQARPRLANFRLVGHSNLDGFADYGDVYAHGRFAYVGSRCGEANRGGDGVQIVDISTPRDPQVVSKLPNPRYTRAEDVTVLDVRTPAFSGALAVVGIQACFETGHESEVVPGVRFFDVTHPAHPRLLGRWNLPRGTVGCHEIDAVQRPGGTVLAGCARNLIDHFTSFENGDTEGLGVYLVNATNPRTPRTVAHWYKRVDPFGGTGCLPVKFAHSLRFENGGRSVYVSYWDAGTVRLNLSDPTSPAVVSDTKIVPPDEDGDNHSMTLAAGGRWLVINPEDFSPGDCPGDSDTGGWGEAYVYDNSDPSSPTFLGTFSTPNSRAAGNGDRGAFTVHDTEVTRRNQFFSSWYSDGIVWWTMNGEGASRLRGSFVPPSRNGVPPLVWGVYLDSRHNLILGSDITTGLWIVRPEGLRDL
ncbi:hypothetical protein BH18ACT15_BH18ACT15_02700 [soil metagenome]